MLYRVGLVVPILLLFMVCTAIEIDFGSRAIIPQVVEKTYRVDTFKITHYCACLICCGKTNGITSIGLEAKPNHTIAADPSILPYGTEVEIDGIIYVVEDCGGAIKDNRLDIFCSTHEEALQRGVIEREVRIYD